MVGGGAGQAIADTAWIENLTVADLPKKRDPNPLYKTTSNSYGSTQHMNEPHDESFGKQGQFTRGFMNMPYRDHGLSMAQPKSVSSL